jgi:hypothetical protein
MASRAQPAARGVARFLAKPKAKPAAKGGPKSPQASSAAGDAVVAGEPSKASPSLKIPELLSELEELFKQLGVRLTYEALGGELGSGGLCKVKGQFRIIIDRRTTPSERVGMLLPLLLRFEIDALPQSATLRDLLARLRPAKPAEEEATDAVTAEHIAVAADAAQPQLVGAEAMDDAVAQAASESTAAMHDAAVSAATAPSSTDA